jgi:feruloyl esterase
LGHGGGGGGPTRFGNAGAAPSADADHDVFTALERWVERGVAPERIIGTGIAADDAAKTLTRPLCAYPKRAQYRGGGDVNDAASFVCAP